MKTGGVSSGRPWVSVVAQAQLDAWAELSVGGIDAVLGHVAEGLFGGGAALVPDGAAAGFAVIRGR